MTLENYPAQVADLIARSFTSLGTAFTHEPGVIRDELLAQAQLQIQAAQAAATLNTSREERIRNLILVATGAPADGGALNPEITRSAYEAALVMLGLAAGDEDPDTEEDEAWLEALNSGLHNDDMGDLP